MIKQTAMRLLLACALLLTLLSGGCARTTTGKTIRMDIPEPVNNLDPQFASDPTSRMIILNLFEGLTVRRGDGSVEPGAAESWQVSPDGLTYTFTLREGVCWQDGEPLRAEDFLHSFRRIFQAVSPSPYARDFLSIKNAREILSGTAPIRALGVEAPDPRTVVFRLEYPNDFFPELLATAPAVPCNEERFTQARGRYGLEEGFVYSNGPFSLERWDNTRYLILGRNDRYVSHSPALPGKIYLYVARENPSNQFLSGKSDVVQLPFLQVEKARERGAKILPHDKTVWCIVFNQNDPVWGNPLLRQGLAQTADSSLYRSRLPENLIATGVFVPPDLLLSGDSYRALAGDDSPLGFDPDRGRYLFDLGLDMLGRSSLPQTVVLVPDTGSHALCLSLIQQDWQNHLGAYINISQASESLIQSRLLSGDYQMLLMPFTPDSSRPESLLDIFSSDNPQNKFGYNNARFDQALLTARGQGDILQAARNLKAAEDMLLLDAAVIPLYFETTYYALGEGVAGIEILPSDDLVLFKYAEKP